MITLIFGSMYSGKTTELIRQLERAYIAKKRVILLRPKIDSRNFLSHSKKETSWLKEQKTDFTNFYWEPYDTIGIDEGQFQTNLKEFCIKCNKVGKDIIISALHATSECQMFQPIIDIIPYCENIIKLNAVCMDCQSDFANYTYHLGGEKTNQVEVGGIDKYIALCSKCYNKRINNREVI